MLKSTAVIVVGLLTVASATAPNAAPAAGKDVEDFLNAPVWYLEYEVSFKSSAEGSVAAAEGPMTFTTSVAAAFSAALALDMRSPGANMSMSLGMGGSADGSAPTAAQVQKMTLDMMERMDTMANWMNSGVSYDENASIEEAQAAAMAHMDVLSGPARFEYVDVMTGDNLVSDFGSKYNQTVRQTLSGAGRVLPDGPILFEIDAAAKTFTLSLPVGFNNMDDLTAVKGEAITRTEPAGGQPEEQRVPIETDLTSVFPSVLAVDDKPDADHSRGFRSVDRQDLG